MFDGVYHKSNEISLETLWETKEEEVERVVRPSLESQTAVVEKVARLGTSRAKEGEVSSAKDTNASSFQSRSFLVASALTLLLL